MKLILNQDVQNLGEEGDICDVADGYGRNYLIPKKIAVPYSKENIAFFDHRRDAIEKRKEDKRKEALGLKERLESEELEIARPAGESGKLFGSVNNANVAEELEKRGIPVEKKRIDIPENTIKAVGDYKIRVKLYDKETAEINLKVTASEEEEK